MNPDTETPIEAQQRRARLAGSVDFTMMYVAHDAFARDISRLITAARLDRMFTPAAVAVWDSFSHQLHVHHTAEDVALWPRLHDVVTADESAILTAMESEHADLDPRLERIGVAIAGRRGEGLLGELRDLGAGLSAHMRHEEEEALPLLERRLGPAGWEAFTGEIRQRVGGIRGGAHYLPWVLDGASPVARRAVLGTLPPPARLLYRTVWEPRYRRTRQAS